jgi:xylono-1,5-lactonase
MAAGPERPRLANLSQNIDCAFGGPQWRTLFIGSVCVGLSEQRLQVEPLAGALFAVEVEAIGLPAATFGGA